MSSEEKVSLIFAFKTKPALERLAEQFVSYWMSYVLGSELKGSICLLLKKTLSNISSVFM